MGFTKKPFRTGKAFIDAIDEYLKYCKDKKILATAQGFCNKHHFRYELYESELSREFPDAYAYAREGFYAAAVNAPYGINPSVVKSIVDWHLKYYGSIVEQNAEESRITIEMDDNTKQDAK